MSDPKKPKIVPKPVQSEIKDKELKALYESGKPVSEETGQLGTNTLKFVRDEDAYIYANDPYNFDPNDPTLDRQMHKNQPFAYKMLYGVKGFRDLAIGSAVTALSIDTDPEMFINMISGKEKEYSNMLMDFGASITENGQEALEQIKLRNPEKVMDFGDTGFWIKSLAQTGTSFGMAVESLAMTALTAGLGSETTILSGANKMNWLKTLSFNTINFLKSSPTKALTYGFFRRYNESVMEAADIFKVLKQEYLDKGYNEEEAANYAAIGASTTYKINMPYMIFDALEFATWISTPGLKSGVGFVDKIMGKIKSPIARGILKQSFSAVEEGFEEGYQNIAQKEGLYSGELAGGLVEESPFSSRFNDYLKDPELYNAMFSGALGSLVLGPVMGGYGRMMESSAKRKRSQSQNDFMNKNLLATRAGYLKELNIAVATNNKIEAENINKKRINQSFLTGLMYDVVNDQSTNFEKESEFYKELVKLSQQKDPQIIDKALREIGLTEEAGYTSEMRKSFVEGKTEFFQEMVDNANMMKALFEKNIKRFKDINTIGAITAKEFNLNKLKTTLQDVQSKIQETEETEKADITDYGRNLYSLNVEKMILEKQIERNNAQLKVETDKKLKDQLSKINVKLNEQLQLISTQIENNQVYNEKGELVEDTRKVKQKKSDNKIIKNIKKNEEYIRNKSQEKAIKKAIQDLQADIKVMNTKAYRQIDFIKHNLEAIETVKTLEELKALKEQLIKDEEYITDFKSTIEKKEKELKIKKVQEITAEQIEAEKQADIEKKLKEQPLVEKLQKHLSIIDGIKIAIEEEETPISIPVVEKKETLDTEDADNIADDIVLSPGKFDENSLSDAVKQQLKEAILNLYLDIAEDLDKIGITNFFQILIEKFGREYVKSNFNKIIIGWKLNTTLKKLDEVEIAKIRISLFEDRADRINRNMQIINDIDIEQQGNVENFEKQKDKSTETLEEDISKNNEFINEDPRVMPRISYTSRQNSVYIEVLPDGTEVVKGFKDESNLLNEAEITTEYKNLLDPDKYPEDSKFVIKVLTEEMLKEKGLEDLVILVRDEKGKTINKISFKEFNNTVPQNSNQYWEKVPMIILSEKGDVIGFVHQPDWHNENTVYRKENEDIDTYKSIIYAAQQENLKLRQTVRSNHSKNQDTGITLVRKSPGVLFTIKTNDNENPKPVFDTLWSRAELDNNKETFILMSDNNGQLSAKSLPNDKSEIINANLLAKEENKNRVYEVKYCGTRYTKKGVAIKQYEALPLVVSTYLNNETSAASFNSVLMAAKIFMYKDFIEGKTKKNPNPSEISDVELKDLKKAYESLVKVNNRFNILNPHNNYENLKDYLNLFFIQKSNYNTNRTDFNQAVTASKENGVVITLDSKGNLILGAKTSGALGTQDNGVFAPNSNFKAFHKRIADLQEFWNSTLKDTTIENRKSSTVPLSRKGFEHDIMLLINTDGTVTKMSYREYLAKNFLFTDVKSHNIGTKENPNYIYRISPVYNFKPNDEVFKKGEIAQKLPQPKTQIIENENVQETAPVEVSESTPTTLTEPYDNIKKEALEKSEFMIGFREDVETDDKIELKGYLQGIPLDYQLTVIKNIYNRLFNTIDFENLDKISKEDIKNTIKDIIEKEIYAKEASFTDILEQLNSITNKDTETEQLIRTYNKILEYFKILREGYNKLEEIAIKRFEHKAKVSVLSEQEYSNEEDEQGSNTMEKKTFGSNLGKESKTSTSLRVLRFLGAVPKTTIDKNGKGNEVKGFLGLTEYEDIDEVFDTLRELINLNRTDNNIDKVIDVLNEHIPEYPWIIKVIEKLTSENTTVRMKKDFVLAMVKDTINMQFLAYSIANDSYYLDMWNTNGNDNAKNILNSWYSQIHTGLNSLVDYKNSQFVFNRSVAETIYKEIEELYTLIEEGMKDSVSPKAIKNFNDFIKEESLLEDLRSEKDLKLPKHLNLGKSTTIFSFGNTYELTMKDSTKDSVVYSIKKLENESNDVLRKTNSILLKLGINLDKNTLKVLVHTGLRKKSFKEHFTAKDEGLFKIISEYVKGVIDNPNPTYYVREEADNIFKNTVFRQLASLDARYNADKIVSSFRDNKKTISSFTEPKLLTDTVRRLKKESEYRDLLGSKVFSEHSMWLEELQKDEDFRDVFNFSYGGLTLLKQIGRELFRDNGIHNLDISDIEFVMLGFFQNMKQGLVNTGHNINGIPTRISTMFTPTMSDKDVVMLLKTIVLKINEDVVTLDKDNNITFSESLQQVLFSQLVLPELERIIQSNNRANDSNIKGYEDASKMFLAYPLLNNVEIEVKGKKVNVLEYLKETKEDKFSIINRLKQPLGLVIQDYMKNLSLKKIEDWKSQGIVYTEEHQVKTKFDSIYLKSFKTNNLEQKILLSALDMTINSHISNSNYFMLIGGDPALYSGKTEGKTITQIHKDTFVNTTKRLASMIAPGISMEGATNNEYIQLFLSDYIKPSSIFDYYCKLLDNKELTDELKQDIRTTFEKGTAKQKKDLIKKIEAIYPKAAPYLTITATDAQEYTTLKEHLYVLDQLARLDNDFEFTTQEIKKVGDLLENKSYNELTEEEQKFVRKVLQPVKPVYAGHVEDKQNDIMRMIYIKSSSFPLVAGLTANKELDKLRLAMEKIEREKGKTVRASYQTANKVGSPSTPITIFNYDGEIEPLNVEAGFELGSMVLPRRNFRIQQEVPFKDSKNEISLGTQEFKILLSNLPSDVDYTLYGATSKVSLAHLKETYNNTFDAIYTKLNQDLFDELGIDIVTGEPKDVVTSFRKLNKLLKREAEDRDWSEKSLEGLQVSLTANIKFEDEASKPFRLTLEEYDNLISKNFDALPKDKFSAYIEKLKKIKGNNFIEPFKKNSIQFDVPLWANPDFWKIESFLNSIVENRVAKLKMPGNSYVVGSNAGWKMSNNIDNQKTFTKDMVIYMPNYNGEELHSSYVDENNVFHPAQILIPSKLRDNNGEIIDLLKEPDKYFKTENGRKVLKTEMFDENVLKQIAFRIPTSKHGSLATVEIVGFLPHSAGDLIIVPKDFTTQKGLDFDVDKEYCYHLYTYQTPEGKIVPLEEKYKDVSRENYIEENVKEYKDLLKDLHKLVNIDSEMKELVDEMETYVNMGFEELIKDTEKIYEKKGEKWDALINKYSNNQSFDEAINTLKTLIKERTNNIRTAKQDEIKLLKNKVIHIHQAVLSNTSPKIQKLVSSTLSMKIAQDEAEYFEQFLSKENKYSTAYDNSYQAQQYVNASTSKIGTGAYSLDIVGHGLFEQAKSKGEPLSLVIPIYNKGILVGHRPVEFNIGGISTKTEEGISLLGGFQTLAENGTNGERTIFDVLSERQNLMLDDAKERIAYRVGLNKYTLDADKILTLLGYDMLTDKNEKGEILEQHSVSFMLLSQPIIKDFVKIVSALNAATSDEFVSDKTQEAYERVFEKWAGMEQKINEYFDENVNEINVTLEKSTLSKFKKQLTEPTTRDQLAYLKLFIDLSAYGKSVRSIQTSINVDSQGIGLNLIEAEAKADKIKELLTDTTILGSSKFIGDFKTFNSIISESEQSGVSAESIIKDLLSKGYIRLDGFFIKPNTVPVISTLRALSSVKTLWSKFFPYNYSIFRKYVNEITSSTSKVMEEDKIGTEHLELIQEIMTAFQMYSFTEQNSGIFKEDVDILRDDLFYDTENHLSLASYISNIKMRLNDETLDLNIRKNIEAFIKNNEFIAACTTRPGENGLMLWEFLNSNGQYIENEVMHNAFATLYNKAAILPDKNGQPYDTKKLIEDLIAYSYLGSGVQRAIEFVKYIPSKILDKKGFLMSMKRIDLTLKRETGKPYKFGDVEPFTIQFFQHNPHRAYRMTLKEIVEQGENKHIKNTKRPDNVNHFVLEVPVKAFISIYNKNVKGKRKFDLYKFNPENNTYEKIPIYTTFGMHQYNRNITDSTKRTSLEQVHDTTFKPDFKRSNHVIHEGNIYIQYKHKEGDKLVPRYYKFPIKDRGLINTFGVRDNSLKEVIDNIIEDKEVDNQFYKELLKLLKLNLTDDVILKVLDFSNTEKFKTTEGFYISKVIGINNNLINNTNNSKEDIARVILHEVLHSVLDSQVLKYIDAETGDFKGKPQENLPVYQLSLLYKEYIKYLKDNGLYKSKKELTSKSELLTSEETKAYGGSDIREFVTLMMSDKSFQSYCANIKYKDTNKSIFEKFVELVKKFIDKLSMLAKTLNTEKIDTESITAQSIATILEILEPKTTIENKGWEYLGDLTESRMSLPTLSKEQTNFFNYILNNKKILGYKSNGFFKRGADLTSMGMWRKTMRDNGLIDLGFNLKKSEEAPFEMYFTYNNTFIKITPKTISIENDNIEEISRSLMTEDNKQQIKKIVEIAKELPINQEKINNFEDLGLINLMC